LMPNVVNITLDEARELVSNRLLWPRVSEFLWDFAPQVHESWLEDVLATKNAENAKNGKNALCDLCALCGKERNAPRVKRYILESLGVEPCFHTFPKEDGSRILLLDSATLESAAKWLGALACAESLRRVTSGEVVRGLKSKLRGIYPEVFGFSEYFRKLKVENVKCTGGEDVGEHIVRVGSSLLFALVGQLPKPLRDRLRFKLPKALSSGECSDSQLSALNFKLSTLQLLLKLRFPEAYKLCC